MIDIRNLVYCELNLPYDRGLFCNEVDEHLIPTGQMIRSVPDEHINDRAQTNIDWKMMPSSQYNIPGNNLSWIANSLLYCETDNKEFRDLSSIGSIVVRNNLLEQGDWRWKPEYEHLALTKFVKSLPLTDIIHARILCMPEGRMSSIHRDNKRSQLSSTLLADHGYISITLNLSDGGQPLYFAMLENEKQAIKTTAPIFIFNDYNLHGVPPVTSMRRQVRVTGRPTIDLYNYLKMDTIRVN